MNNDKISIITLSYNGRKYLAPLFDSIRKQTYDNFEIILVDNASTDGSVEFVEREYPEVKIVKNAKNLGFADGNNSALPSCSGKYIALINNDMVVSERWLEQMHGSLLKNDADVVGPKILFYKPFITLRFEMEPCLAQKKDPLDGEAKLGCKVSSDISIEGVEYKKTIFHTDTHGEEKEDGTEFHRVFGGGLVKIPVALDLPQFLLKFSAATLSAPEKMVLKIHLGDALVFNEMIGGEFREFNVLMNTELIKKQACYVINNAGSEFDPGTGSGKDIGMYADDEGQYDNAHEAFSLCGGSMLIKKDLVEKIGLFDGYFFAYYEDTDFCWRVRKAKGKMFYEPSSVVYHIHTGTSKEWSPFFRYHVERNRLAMILKNGAWADIAKEWALFFLHTLKDLVVLSKRAVFNFRKMKESDNVRKIHVKVAADLMLHLLPLLLKRIRIGLAVGKNN